MKRLIRLSPELETQIDALKDAAEKVCSNLTSDRQYVGTLSDNNRKTDVAVYKDKRIRNSAIWWWNDDYPQEEWRGKIIIYINTAIAYASNWAGIRRDLIHEAHHFVELEDLKKINRSKRIKKPDYFYYPEEVRAEESSLSFTIRRADDAERIRLNKWRGLSIGTKLGHFENYCNIRGWNQQRWEENIPISLYMAFTTEWRKNEYFFNEFIHKIDAEIDAL